MGTIDDMAFRESDARKDSNARQSKVEKARQHISKGKGVDSAPVEALLSDESLVPTTVCSESKNAT